MLAWLFGGSRIARLVLFVLAALGGAAALLAAKAAYDRARRREGARDVLDEINEQGRKRREKMEHAPRPRDDQELDELLRSGRA